MTDYTEFDGGLYGTDPSYMVTVNGSSLGMTFSLNYALEDYAGLCDESNGLVKLIKIFPQYNLEEDTFDYGFAIKITVKTNMDYEVVA
jgi:hypothetical protein|tara:strand:+ start:39 stop:302 length:264 start_codon:yes stop_codon:yes gene_type:complete